MTRQEYAGRRASEVSRHNAALREIDREFALSNNPVQVGDILFHHSCTILVEKIKVYRGGDAPSCVYEGPRLKKDLTPRKDGSTDSIWQMNIKRHLRDGKDMAE